MIVTIHQPNFFPWLGYFDKINQADQFVIIDEVKFIKGSYCNRAKIKNNVGQEVWLTIPVHYKEGNTFNETMPSADKKWQNKAVNLLKASYVNAPFYKKYHDEIVDLVCANPENIATMNIEAIKWVCKILKIHTPIHLQSFFKEDFGRKNDLNLNIVKKMRGSVYLSGNGAKKYNDESLFIEHDVVLEYHSFTHPKYDQVNGDFISGLSILDVLFNKGEDWIQSVLHG